MELKDNSTLKSDIHCLLIEADTPKNLLEYNLENARLLLEDLIDEMDITWSTKDRKIHIIHDCIVEALDQYEDMKQCLNKLSETTTTHTCDI